MPGSISIQLGWDLEPPGLVDCVSAHSQGLELDGIWGPFYHFVFLFWHQNGTAMHCSPSWAVLTLQLSPCPLQSNFSFIFCYRVLPSQSKGGSNMIWGHLQLSFSCQEQKKNQCLEYILGLGQHLECILCGLVGRKGGFICQIRLNLLCAIWKFTFLYCSRKTID